MSSSSRVGEILNWCLLFFLALATADVVIAYVEGEIRTPERAFSPLPQARVLSTESSVSLLAQLLTTSQAPDHTALERLSPTQTPRVERPDFQLEGLMAGPNGAGLAFLNREGKTIVVGVRQQIPGTSFTVTRVEAQTLHIGDGSHHFQIPLIGSEPLPKPQTVPQNQAAEPQPPSVEPIVSKSELEALLENPSSLEGVRVKSEIVEGEMVGARIAFSDSNHPLARLGLLDGDLVRSINGTAIDNTSAVSKIFPILKNSDTLVFEIVRGGAEQTLTVELD